MAGTLDALAAHLDQQVGRARVVVWEHNSHIGDARATELGDRGELNVGELVRSRWPDDCLLVGFTTYSGRVTAASEWGGPAERKHVRPALPGSYEALLHRTGRHFVLPMQPAADLLAGPMLERAIGVIYRPHTERESHWFHARLPQQFDAIVHIDQSTAVAPLERTSRWDAGEPPETYPTGL
jgi:erythromycin esterase-like protein